MKENQILSDDDVDEIILKYCEKPGCYMCESQIVLDDGISQCKFQAFARAVEEEVLSKLKKEVKE